MKQSLPEYCQETLPKHTLIDQQISPLLSKVRIHNINCLHQLGEEIQTYHSQVLPNNQKRTNVFQWRSPKHKPKYGQGKDETSLIAKKYSLAIKTRMKRPSVSVSSSRANPEDEYVPTSSFSKVKRHLIDTIDFHELQRAMYQKSQKVSRFEHFCHSLRQRGPSQSTSRSNRSQRNTLIIQDQKQAPDNVASNYKYEAEDNSFRITHKKRFWKGKEERCTSQKKGLAQRRLEVHGNASTIS